MKFGIRDVFRKKIKPKLREQSSDDDDDDDDDEWICRARHK